MAYIKANQNGLYVYKSVTDDKGTQKCVYVSSYQEYRINNPKGSFNDLLGKKTLDRWIKDHPERIEKMLLIDADVSS